MNHSDGKSHIILGFGATGASLARFLGANGERAIVVDDNPERLRVGDDAGYDNCEFVSVATVLGSSTKYLDACQNLYVSPGVRPHHQLVQAARTHGLTVASDIDLFLRHCQVPVIGVTGTNGKSTVVSLLEELLNQAGVRAHAGGNLGRPALDLLGAGQADYFVLELSSFQLHYMDPGHELQIGILTNISSDHLDFHTDYADYIASKRKIFFGNRYSIFYRDQCETRLACSASNASFGYSRSQRDQDFGLLRCDDGLFMTRGRHTLSAIDDRLDKPLCFCINLMPALALMDWLGLDLETALEGGLRQPLLEHRYQRIDSDDGLRWIDASKATNPQATIASLPANTSRLILLIGGDVKGADMSVINPHIDGIKKLIVYSESAPTIIEYLRTDIEIEVCPDLTAAVHAAKQHARPGDTILLAPGAASQPSYLNYRDRGVHFSKLVVGSPTASLRS